MPSGVEAGKSVKSIIVGNERNTFEKLNNYPINGYIPLLDERFRMKKTDNTCSSCALFAFNGIEQPKKRLNTHELLDLTQTDFFCFETILPIIGIFGNSNDRTQGFLMYVENKKFIKTKETITLPSGLFTNRLLLLIFEDYFYPKGHCIAIWPSHESHPGVWGIRDPFRPDGTSVAVDKRQLLLILASASFIYF